jgi:hypothetical protein
MAVLSKLITKTVTKVIKNLTKFEVAIDGMLDKFKDSCPTKAEILKIVRQKNQIQSSLENVISTFNTVEIAAGVAEGVLSATKASVIGIKTIPVPVSVPPGIGVPTSVITLLADSLDFLGDIVKGEKGALKAVPMASKVITSAGSIILTKLQQLDTALNSCIEELAEDMTQEEKNNLITEIANIAATSGDFENIDLNIANEESLLANLQSNTINPYRYTKPGDKDPNWLFIIEFNTDNTLSFPQRRIKATNTSTSDTDTLSGAVVYNLPGGGYSYSSSVKVLIEETKFRIDQLLRPLEDIPQGFGPDGGDNNTDNNTDNNPNNNTDNPLGQYFPFTGPGSINNEIRFFLSTPYKYIQSSNSWVFTTISQNLQPFGIAGAYNGEVRRLPIQGEGQDEFYTWNQLLYSWSLQ